MRLLNSDGTPGESLRSDGQNLDVMPSFTPDGTQIVFTSDRSGQGLDVWRMRLSGPGAGEAKRIARGGEKAALWPMIDASPKARLFYEEFLKPGAGHNGAGGSEIHMVELEADPPTNMTLAAGTRPRTSPRADAVVFTVVDPNTGNRDLYLVADKDGVPLGGDPVNLTNTPDVDECDPAWSRTGGKIAYASNAGADETNRRNYDLYVLTVTAPQQPARVTYNGSLDDSPAWDATGRSLFFRSNRGGKWGVWKAQVP
jgi:Tol biopolymer transport system component